MQQPNVQAASDIRTPAVDPLAVVPAAAWIEAEAPGWLDFRGENALGRPYY
jgi:hypothetical protein